MSHPAPTPYTDMPIRTIEEDRFWVSPYIDALCAFIRNSETPITIALQGEWGCGKSSFMNLIRQQLCDPKLPDSERFEPITINAWEFFLEDDFDQAVNQLTKSIIYQMSEHFEELQRSHVAEGRKAVAKEAADTLAKVVLNVINVGGETLDNVRSLAGNFMRNTNSLLQNKADLERVIMQDDSCRAFVIFVDDLDRLTPQMAVTLMESMKILFEMRKCIFVVAVDYEVIENGIELKYGRSVAGSRDIARDFFDKLIQLPFRVPMESYRIRNYLQEQLKRIGFFARPHDYVTHIDEIETIFTLATRKNPRTMKSVLNMFQAMDLLDGKANDRPDYQLMELLLIVFQKCFPRIYLMLAERQSLNQWNSALHVEIPQEVIDFYGLNSPWKQRIYLMYQDDDLMKKNFYRIFRLLEMYEQIQERCLRDGEVFGDLFSLLNLMVGHSVQAGNSLYDGRAYDAHSDIQKQQGNMLIAKIGDFSAYRTVLDVGCGNGKTTIEMWEKNPSMVVTAIDTSKSQLNVAIGHFDRTVQEMPVPPKGHVEFLLEDAAQISGTAKYDLVFSNAALHWVGSRVYAALFRALKPGGDLAVHQGARGTYEQYHAAARLAIRELGYEKYYERWTLPVYYPDKREMEQLLADCGFEEIRVEQDVTYRAADEALTEAFIAASLTAYRTVLTDEHFEALKERFREICASDLAEVTVSRLYIFAKRPVK